jgi:hypothetical protein
MKSYSNQYTKTAFDFLTLFRENALHTQTLRIYNRLCSRLWGKNLSRYKNELHFLPSQFAQLHGNKGYVEIID